MNPALIPVLFFGSFIGIALLIASRAAQETKRAWFRMAGLAETLGLTMTPAQITLGRFYTAPHASGECRGKTMEIFSFTTGSGKSSTRWWAISAQPRATGGFTFSLMRQGFGTKLLELFGKSEIQVGDAVFDGRWFIQTNQPDFFRTALLPELRAKLDAALPGNWRGEFKLEGGKVVYAETGGLFDAARVVRFEAVADAVCDLADVAEIFAESAGG